MHVKYHLKVLPSGMKVLLIPTQKSKLFRLELHVHVGYLQAPPEKLEVPHVLEHMQAKLTSTKYPKAFTNKAFLEDKGIFSNGTTYLDITSIQIEGVLEHFDISLDMMLHTLTHFKVDEEIYETELKAVKTEIYQRLERDYQVVDAINQYSLRKTNLKNFSVKNRLATLDDITPSDLIDFRKKYYALRNCLISISGDIEPMHVYKKIKKFMRPYYVLDYITPRMTQTTLPVTKPTCMFVQQPADAPDLCYVNIRYFNTLDNLDTDAEVLNFIHFNLTNGISGPLVNLLRNDIGGVYTVTSDHVSWYNGVNYENIVTHCSESTLVKVIEGIVRTIEDIKAKPMDNTQLEKNRNTLVYLHLRSRYENSLDSYLDWYSTYAIRNRNLVPVRTVYKRLIRLNASQIMDATQYAFPSSNILISYTARKNHNEAIQKALKVPLTLLEKKI